MTWKYPDNGELPEPYTYVLCEHRRGTWRDSHDSVGVNFVVLKFVPGMSLAERELLKSQGSMRANVWSGDDEGSGNNLRPYGWNQFGPDHFFGQDILRWMEIPK